MSLAERQIWIDGELLPWERATLHLLSVSAQRGYLAFDVLYCHWQGERAAVIGLREHAQRFLRSVELAAMSVAFGADVPQGREPPVRATAGSPWATTRAPTRTTSRPTSLFPSDISSAATPA